MSAFNEALVALADRLNSPPFKGNLMPITFTKLTREEVAEEFKRAASNEDSIAEYVSALKDGGIGVGDGFTLPVVRNPEQADTSKEDAYLVRVTDDTAETMRACKRRFNAAAKTIGLNLKWKVSADRVNGQAIPRHLVVRASSSTVTESTEDGTSKKRGRPKKDQEAAPIAA